MILELTDQQVFDISKLLYNSFRQEEKAKRIDADNLKEFQKQYIKPLYPHKEITDKNGETHIKKYTCSEYCCKLSPGRFMCCKTTEPDRVYREFGLGVCIYAKFIKHLVCFLAFVSLLSAFSVFLYYMVAVNHGYGYSDSYQAFLFSSTVGTVSSLYSKCEYSLLESGQSTFSIKCPTGQIDLLGPVFTNLSKSDVTNCRLEKQKYLSNQFIPQSYEQSKICNTGLNQCNITIQTNIQTHQNSSSYTYTSLSYNYKCKNSVYQLGDLQLTDQIILYIIAGIDIFIIIIFIVFLISEDCSEQAEINHFKQKNLAVHDFTLKIHGFNLNNIEQQLDQFIRGYYDTEIISGKKNKNSIVQKQDLFSNIVQIKLPEDKKVLQKTQKRRQSYQNIFNLIEECFFEERVDLRKYKNSQDFIKKCYSSADSLEYREYKNCLSTLIMEFINSKKQLKNQRKTKVNETTHIYLTLSNLRYKRRIFERSKQTCLSHQLKVYNKKYTISEPPVADMIIWENRYKWTCCRVLFFWLITLIICFGSYLLVGIAQFKKNQLAANNNFNQDCNVLFNTNQLQVYDIALVNEKAYMHCYCSYHFYESITALQLSVSQDCQVWFKDYALYLAIPLLISIGIVVYNLLISRFFKKMTTLEAHEQRTSQLYSYIVKRSFVLILNMGLILILLNLNYNGNWNNESFQFLFVGTYSDITPDWYYNIGVVITLTLCFNILLPIFQLMLESLLKCLRKCWDTKCCTRKTSKKTKKQYIQLYSGDVYPIEERYADLISVVVIVLAFSSVMPLVYIIGFLSLAFMQLSDKVLLFKVYQKPINYTSSLQNKIFKTIYLSLIIHCVISAILLSSDGLIEAVGTITVDIVGSTGTQRFDYIIQSPHLLPYVIIFIILCVWAIMYLTVIQLCSYCVQKCSKKIDLFHRQKLNANFLTSLNNYQLNRVKNSAQKQISLLQQTTKDKLLRQSNTQMVLAESHLPKKYMMQLIAERTQSDIDKLIKIPSQQRNADQNMILIGKAGYDQLFDDDIHERDKKIKILDRQLKVMFNKNKESQRGQSIGKPVAFQDSGIELFIK